MTSTCAGTFWLYRVAAGFLAGVTLSIVTATMTIGAAQGTRGPEPSPAGCERLAALALPHAKITTAQRVAAGAFSAPGAAQQSAAFKQLPAFCRVAATLTPSPDSRIEMELWLPAENWNGKFLAVGNGGWAGNIELDAMAAGLRRGYAAASNDTGHQDAGAAFALPSREGRRFRLPRDARDDGAVESRHRELLQPRPAARRITRAARPAGARE